MDAQKQPKNVSWEFHFWFSRGFRISRTMLVNNFSVIQSSDKICATKSAETRNLRLDNEGQSRSNGEMEENMLET